MWSWYHEIHVCEHVPWHHRAANLGWYVVSHAFSQKRKVVKMKEAMYFGHVHIYGLIRYGVSVSCK